MHVIKAIIYLMFSLSRSELLLHTNVESVGKGQKIGIESVLVTDQSHLRTQRMEVNNLRREQKRLREILEPISNYRLFSLF